MNSQDLLFVVLIAALGATGFVLFKKYNPATASALVVRNVSDQLLTVQVGNQTPAPLAKDATTQDEFVEGMMVKVWVGEGTKTTSVGWRIFKIRGELALNYANGEVVVSGEGLDQTPLNNGPGGNAGKVPEKPLGNEPGTPK